MTQLASLPPVLETTWSRQSRWKRLKTAWEEAPPRTRVIVQLAVLLCMVAVAYNYSLSTLIQNAGLETPLAYVSLVPAIALALAAVRAKPMRPEPQIHDRQLDYIVGIPLIFAALAANLFLPTKMSAMFWVYRIDLLTLPIFVAGAVTIIFGTRVLWRQKLAVCYLLLAWPYPYQSVLLRVLDAFTTATIYGTVQVLRVLPVAKAIQSPDSTLFVVTHHGTSFPVSVVSACSGVNSVVGFLLIGSAFGAVVRGPMVRKVLWLAGGMILLWCINIGRIVFILYAGHAWGEVVSIDILHPYIGLFTFSLGVLAMIVLIKPLGMHVGMAWREPVRGLRSGMVGSGRPATVRTAAAVAVPKLLVAVVIVAAAGIVLGISNVGLKTYNLVADASGDPKLTAFIETPTAPPGWRPREIATYDWARPLFGDTSVWNRYSFVHIEGGNLQTTQGVIGDVIVTPDLSSFSAYGVEACYQFHGYTLRDVAQVNVGGGITGQAMSYDSQQFGSWSIVYWIIPVKVNNATEYERVVLYVQNTGRVQVVPGAASVSGITNVAGNLDPSDRLQAELIANRSFLVAFARELIQTEANGHILWKVPVGPNNRLATALLPSSARADAVVSLSKP